MCENARGTTTRAQSLEAPTAATQILRACAVEVHMDDVERHECTVNSSESAAHARALRRSKHQLPFYYRKNPSVCPHCLGNKVTYGTYLCFGNPVVRCQDSAPQSQLRCWWLLQTLPSLQRSGSTTPETSEIGRIKFACRRKEELWTRTERANVQKSPQPADWLIKQIRIFGSAFQR